MKRVKRVNALSDPYRGQHGSLSYWKLKAIMKAELHKLQSPVAHIDPATLDIADLIRRAEANR